MSRLLVAPIVEGHGEASSAIRTLITRIWTELLGGDYADVLRAVRQPRGKLLQRDGLLKARSTSPISTSGSATLGIAH